MNRKKQYQEAYRIVRLLWTMYPTMEERLQYVAQFDWKFDAQSFIAAMKSRVNS